MQVTLLSNSVDVDMQCKLYVLSGILFPLDSIAEVVVQSNDSVVPDLVCPS